MNQVVIPWQNDAEKSHLVKNFLQYFMASLNAAGQSELGLALFNNEFQLPVLLYRKTGQLLTNFKADGWM
jgi:hypothetical protein